MAMAIGGVNIRKKEGIRIVGTDNQSATALNAVQGL
jgi:hypothetical protein